MPSPGFEPNPDLARYIALTRRRSELEWQILCRERIDMLNASMSLMALMNLKND